MMGGFQTALVFLTFYGTTMAQVATTLEKGGCNYNKQSYDNLDTIPHPSGCGVLQCQFGDVVPIYEACGTELDNQCHSLNENLVYNNQRYRCTKSTISGVASYTYSITEMTSQSPINCILGNNPLKDGELFTTKDTCRTRQCQNGSIPFLKAACTINTDKKCRFVGEMWNSNGSTVTCDFINRVFKTLPVKISLRTTAAPKLTEAVPTLAKATTRLPTDARPKSTAVRACNPLKETYVLFVLDTSGSVPLETFYEELHLTKMVVGVLKSAFWGAITFGTTATTVSDLTNDAAEFSRRLINAGYHRSTTDTRAAIDLASSLLAKAPKTANRIIIIFTDGLSSNSPLPSVEIAHQDQIITIAVGIGQNPNEVELNALASDKSKVINLKTSDDITLLARTVKRLVCFKAAGVKK